MTKIGSGPGMINKLYRGSFMGSLHANSERGRFIGNLVNPSRGLGVDVLLSGSSVGCKTWWFGVVAKV